MFIIGLGTVTPAKRYTQKECWEVFSKSDFRRTLSSRSQAIVKKVLNGNNGIESRHLALDKLTDAFVLTPDDLQARFLKNAPALAAQAAHKAIADAGLQPADVDAILISTCTGYLCPGLTSYVSERLGLRSEVFALDLVGQGCGAALPNLRTAEALLESGKCAHVVSCCVEVCSAALYFDDDPGVLISACLFGDGAGAAVLSGKSGPGRRMEWKTSGSLLRPDDRDALRFEHKAGMLRNILTPQVPETAANHAGKLFSETIAKASVPRSEITGWALHPGGRDVLIALREKLQLSEHDTRWSAAILREYGNLSSPSVFFVLDAALHDSAPSGYWWMSSFGAGFSCHGALLKVE
jgi:predicted naringenin-chalcone synthase